jgi:hypothetical protein
MEDERIEGDKRKEWGDADGSSPAENGQRITGH